MVEFQISNLTVVGSNPIFRSIKNLDIGIYRTIAEIGNVFKISNRS